jgi:hypothetical protein
MNVPILAAWAALASAAFGQTPGASLELRVSENGRCFLRGGTPFLWMGDTAWSIVNRYTPEEAAFYLEERRKQGFNVLNIMLLFNGGPGMVTPMADERGELPFLDLNPATPNDRYFRNVDRIVALARESGVTWPAASTLTDTTICGARTPPGASPSRPPAPGT